MPHWLQSMLIALAGVAYALAVSRSKAGSLRRLRRDLIAGRTEGYLVIALVVGLIILAKIDYYRRMGHL